MALIFGATIAQCLHNLVADNAVAVTGVEVAERIYDHSGLCALLAAVFGQAWREARRGDEGAICFLDHTVPTWREWEQRRQRQRFNENDSQVERQGKKNGQQQTQTTDERRQL